MANNKEKHLAAYQGENGGNSHCPIGYGVTTVWGQTLYFEEFSLSIQGVNMYE